MATPLTRVVKDPNAVLDYVVDWSAWLEKSSNDIISSVVWVVPAGITKSSTAFDTTTATVWLSGGSLNKVYTITCRMTTVGGRTEDYSFEVSIQAK
jgi:hypothetical protein